MNTSHQVVSDSLHVQLVHYIHVSSLDVQVHAIAKPIPAFGYKLFDRLGLISDQATDSHDPANISAVHCSAMLGKFACDPPCTIALFMPVENVINHGYELLHVKLKNVDSRVTPTLQNTV